MKSPCYTAATLNTNVSDLVIDSPCLAPLFEKNKVEYCCEGHVPLKQTLQKLNIPTSAFLDLMNETVHANQKPLDYPDTKNPVQVIDYIIEVYHKPLPKMLDELGRLVNKAAEHHGPNKPFTVVFKKTFDLLVDDLTGHLWKEENILFPMIKELYVSKLTKKSQPQFHCGSIGNPISQMEFEHDTVGALLRKMEETLAPENLAETGCTTLKTMKKLFDHLKIEIHKHIHMENYILHPMARALE